MRIISYIPPPHYPHLSWVQSNLTARSSLRILCFRYFLAFCTCCVPESSFPIDWLVNSYSFFLYQVNSDNCDLYQSSPHFQLLLIELVIPFKVFSYYLEHNTCHINLRLLLVSWTAASLRRDRVLFTFVPVLPSEGLVQSWHSMNV